MSAGDRATKIIGIASIAAAILYARSWLHINDDFKSCHEGAMQIVAMWERPGHWAPDVEHDQIDEYLHVCMLGHGYSYQPSAWVHCATEKIQTCYRPSVDSILETIF